MRGVGSWIGVAAMIASSSCFYDSRWMDLQNAKKAAVANATPKELAPTEVPADAFKVTRVRKLRAYATARHAAEVTEWQKQVEDLVDHANRIIGPTLGLRIEVEAAKVWVSAADDDLHAALADLARHDAGEGVEWVLGLTGSLPRLEVSFHQLGMARVMGKHLVMRAMSDAREHEAIERALADVSDEERRKLYRARKKHKAVAVLLHELGHTLGVVHEEDPASVMNVRYDLKAQGYSAAAAGWMRVTLDHRSPLAGEAPRSDKELAKALLDHLTSTEAAWVKEELSATRERLLAMMKRPDKPKPPDDSTALAALPPEHRQAYLDASAALAEQRAGDAWRTLKPLVAAYPDVLAVHDLRCRIAMQLGLPFDVAQKECERLLQLSGVPPAKR